MATLFQAGVFHTSAREGEDGLEEADVCIVLGIDS